MCLIFHFSEKYWLEIIRELWDTYQPFEFKKDDAHVCSFTPIFTDVWGAAYYSNTWSKMIAANAFVEFNEAESDEQLTEIGIR